MIELNDLLSDESFDDTYLEPRPFTFNHLFTSQWILNK